jgi:hypothetical protein
MIEIKEHLEILDKFFKKDVVKIKNILNEQHEKDLCNKII